MVRALPAFSESGSFICTQTVYTLANRPLHESFTSNRQSPTLPNITPTVRYLGVYLDKELVAVMHQRAARRFQERNSSYCNAAADMASSQEGSRAEVKDLQVSLVVSAFAGLLSVYVCAALMHSSHGCCTSARQRGRSVGVLCNLCMCVCDSLLCGPEEMCVRLENNCSAVQIGLRGVWSVWS